MRFTLTIDVVQIHENCCKQSATQQSFGNVGFRSSTQPTQFKVFGANPSVLTSKHHNTPPITLTFHGIWKTSLLFLSSKRRETLNFPPSRDELGVRGLGQWLAFPHHVKSQTNNLNRTVLAVEDADSIKTIRAAYKAGITTSNTAEAYCYLVIW